MLNLLKMGRKCAEMRREKGFTQLHIAMKLGYTSENISAFENGRNDNVRIFAWYLKNCSSETTYIDLIRCIDYEN